MLLAASLEGNVSIFPARYPRQFNNGKMDLWIRVEEVGLIGYNWDNNRSYNMSEQTERPVRNQAFIDGQNVYLATTTAENAWKIDLRRFRVYLEEKYQVERAYYFMGAVDDNHQDLYKMIQEAGFVLMFRKHSLEMTGHKKGNVDTDVVFEIMRKLVDQEDFDKVILISGDGDYFKMVDYLISKKRFGKLLAPSYCSMSSLYKQYVDRAYYAFLDVAGTKKKIAIS